MKTGGIVLCGGQSSRMGKPKAWLPFGNEFMLPRVVRILQTIVEPVVVVAAPGQDVPPLSAEVEIVRDEIEGRGPLGGLAAGLVALSGKCASAYLSACDVPLLRPEFVSRVVSLLGDAAACAPFVGSRLHPLAAVYRLDILPRVRERLASHQLRLMDLLHAISTYSIEETELADVDPHFVSLRNINTPEEYESLLAEAHPTRAE